MNSRERVLSAIEHPLSDCLHFDLGCIASFGILAIWELNS
jgi:hypothetical protein